MIFFALSGLTDAATADPAELVDFSQRYWYNTDHVDIEDRGYSPTNPLEAAKLLSRMGLRGDLVPSSDDYDHVLVPGALLSGLIRRMRFVRRGIDPNFAGKIDVLAGQRQRDPQRLHDTPDATVRVISRLDRHGEGAQFWIGHNIVHDDQGFPTEQELARLALVRVFGGAEIIRKDLDFFSGEAVLSRVVSRDVMRVPGVRSPIAIHNAEEIKKRSEAGMEVRRPTTESTLISWLRDFPPAEGARVLFVTGNPHAYHMTAAAAAVLQREKRDDITLIAAGPDNARASLGQRLGELTRILYLERDMSSSDLVSA